MVLIMGHACGYSLSCELLIKLLKVFNGIASGGYFMSNVLVTFTTKDFLLPRLNWTYSDESLLFLVKKLNNFSFFYLELAITVPKTNHKIKLSVQFCFFVESISTHNITNNTHNHFILFNSANCLISGIQL